MDKIFYENGFYELKDENFTKKIQELPFISFFKYILAGEGFLNMILNHLWGTDYNETKLNDVYVKSRGLEYVSSYGPPLKNKCLKILNIKRLKEFNLIYYDFKKNDEEIIFHFDLNCFGVMLTVSKGKKQILMTEVFYDFLLNKVIYETNYMKESFNRGVKKSKELSVCFFEGDDDDFYDNLCEDFDKEMSIPLME